MQNVTISERATKLHPVLVQRLEALLIAQGIDGCVTIRTASDPVPPGRTPCLSLERDTSNQLTRSDTPGRMSLRYRDPSGETALAAALVAVTPTDRPIAADPESLSVLTLAARLAVSDIPVLIGGPTGTGKEVLSRFIHARSPRRDGPFVAVNCAAMPETMLEALLFGHKKGAFTGATEANEGFFRAADGGTLLLDEIAEMPLGLQAKLLRALQEGEVMPIGATKAIPVDVRIIACANRDLPTEVAEGRFRADLFYRLNVFPLALRPVRDRPEDLAPLALAMIARHTPRGHALPWLSEAALAMLKLHSWPGNVRELENVIRRALLLADGAERIEPRHIAFDSTARLVGEDPADTAPPRLSSVVQRSEAKAIFETLEACGGNRVATARQLGISERTLRYRLASFRDAGLAVAGGRR